MSRPLRFPYVRRLARAARRRMLPRREAVSAFHGHHYLRHNARRQEHLASLGIPLAGASVLEVGAGIGDHSHYFVDRGCRMTITDARPENCRLLKERYPLVDVQRLDLEHPVALVSAPFDVVYMLRHALPPEQARTGNPVSQRELFRHLAAGDLRVIRGRTDCQSDLGEPKVPFAGALRNRLPADSALGDAGAAEAFRVRLPTGHPAEP